VGWNPYHAMFRCIRMFTLRGGTDPLIRSSHKNAAALGMSRVMHVGDYLGLGEAQTSMSVEKLMTRPTGKSHSPRY
jgi:hypothetical protein